MTNSGTAHDDLTHYINHTNPLGPLDTDLIKNSEVEAKLFDSHYTSFDKLLSKDINVIIGRRGSGKTALLNCYKRRPLLNRDSLVRPQISRFDLNDYELVFSAPAHNWFEDIQLKLMGHNATSRPIESVVDDWSRLIGDLMLTNIKERFRTSDASDLEIVTAYLNRDETLERREASELVRRFPRKTLPAPQLPSQQEALGAADEFLRSSRHKALFILDSMDEYHVNDPAADRTVGALLRFVRSFNSDDARMNIKIGLPSEIFPEIQRACANPLKDIVAFDQITWTSHELARVAAHRYRILL